MREKPFITKLLQQQEGEQLAFAPVFELTPILRTICAFLNSKGGWIVIGIEKKHVRGIESGIEEKIAELENAVLSRINPQPLIDARIETLDNRLLILVNVVRGSRQPYAFDNKYYVRKVRETDEADADDISLLMRSSNEYASTWEKQTALDASLEDLENEQVRTTMNEAVKIGRGRTLPTDIPSFLNYFQLIDYSTVRNGAIILFGKDPLSFIPQCRIRITVMPFGKTGSRFDNTLIIEENLFHAFIKVQAFFDHNLPQTSEFRHDEWSRINKGKYPMEAMDEAVLNAMVHRDYADFSGEIVINIYTDKIEIINSGEIPSDIVTEKNKIRPHHSVLRNPIIAHMFFLRGKIEKIGRGLGLIKDRFNEYGLRLPEWSTQSGYTTLTLFGTRNPIDLNERMFTFLKTLKIGQAFSREQYEQFHAGSISEKTARNDIATLVYANLIQRKGSGPSTRYERTNLELPDFAG